MAVKIILCLTLFTSGAFSTKLERPKNNINPIKVPEDFVGSWFLPDQPLNIIPIEESSILGGHLISEPFEYDEQSWEFFANLSLSNGRGERKECIKCFNLEVMHRNVIQMNAGECLLVSFNMVAELEGSKLSPF